MRRLRLPKRILVILEGEGLANDATALILYRFAVAAVSTGEFSLSRATVSFAVIVAGELIWGVGVGWAILRLRRWVRDTRIEILLSVLTPFLAYWPPQHLGGSGVLATVAAGLYISWNGFRLISAATRLQGIFFWDYLIYLIEGMLFLITGLQARAIIEGIRAYTLAQLAMSALLVSAVVIVARFVWTFPATYLPRWLIPAVRRADPSPPWQWPFVLSFTGVRGVVSLAAALAIPLTTETGAPFPERDLILFSDFLRHRRHAGGSGPDSALGDARVGPRRRGPPGAPRRSHRRAGRPAAGGAASVERLGQRAREGTAPEAAIEALRAAHVRGCCAPKSRVTLPTATPHSPICTMRSSSN